MKIKTIDADAAQNVIFSPYLLGTRWLSKAALPGKDLDGGAMWQVLGSENMQFEDCGNQELLFRLR